jgi:hypothetical protein
VNGGGIAGMKPAASHGLACRLGILIIAFHDSIAANDDFTNRLTIVRNIVSFFTHQLAVHLT